MLRLHRYHKSKLLGSDKYSVYLRLLWIDEVSMRFQISAYACNYYFAAKLRMRHSFKPILMSIRQDGVPISRNSSVSYQFKCKCEPDNIGKTTQLLGRRTSQPVSTGIRKGQFSNLHTCSSTSRSAILEYIFNNRQCASAFQLS